MSYSITPERVLSSLSELLVSSQSYQITIGNHIATAKYISHKKALVKDVSKVVERIEKKMPACILILFESFELILVVDYITNITLLSGGIVFSFDQYDVRIEHAVT